MKLNPLAEAAEVVHNRTHATTFIDNHSHSNFMSAWPPASSLAHGAVSAGEYCDTCVAQGDSSQELSTNAYVNVRRLTFASVAVDRTQNCVINTTFTDDV